MKAAADRRRLGIALTVLAVLVGGALLQAAGPLHDVTPPAADELQQRFDAALAELRARRFEPAAMAWQRVLDLAPRLPEAHVNLGFALLGLNRAEAARERFEAATELRPEQANAYYGLALAHEARGDIELAIGAMRTYLHRARQEEPAHLRRARAALWEWESRRPAAAASAPR